jgi:hypothetical protein
MKICGTAAAAVACLLLSACAGLDVGPIKDEAADAKDKGYRYYDQAQYLFVRSDGKGGLTSEIVMLNTSRKFSARPYAYLAMNNTTLSFSNGALNEATVVADETAVPVALADALGKAASAALAFDAPSATATTFNVPLPHLFKIQIATAGTITLVEIPTEGKDGKPAVIQTNIVPPASK